MRNGASLFVSRWRLAAFLTALLMLMGTAWVAAWTSQTEPTEPPEIEVEGDEALAGTLSSVQNLSAFGQPARAQQVAVDPNGNAVFTWQRFDGANWRVQARARSAAGVLSGVQTLSAAGQDGTVPQVGMGSNGNAVFTWQTPYGVVQARARSAGGALSAVQTISTAGPGLPQVAVDPDGNAVFTWEGASGIQARARSANGALSAVQTLSAAGGDEPQVAIDSTGNAVFTWRISDGTNLRIQARARSAAGTLSAIRTLSRAGEHAQFPQVAVDPDGNAVFTWVRHDGANWRVQARARSAAGTLSAVQTLSLAGQDGWVPQVAVDATGNAVFAWERSDGTKSRIQARARAAVGTLSAVRTLSDAGQDAFYPAVAIAPAGYAVFAWSRSDGTLYRAQTRARTAAGTLSAVQNISLNDWHAYYPQVAVDATGDAVFTWWRSDGTFTSTVNRVQARARSGP